MVHISGLTPTLQRKLTARPPPVRNAGYTLCGFNSLISSQQAALYDTALIMDHDMKFAVCGLHGETTNRAAAYKINQDIKPQK